MQRAGIAGATGYTGSELVQWIQRHPHLELGWITSENSAGKKLSDVHAVPWDYPLISLAEAYDRVHEVDVVFLCLPHGESIEAAKRFAAAGLRVIDLSADFRLHNPADSPCADERCAGNLGLTARVLFAPFIATQDRKSTRLNSSHSAKSRMPSSA